MKKEVRHKDLNLCFKGPWSPDEIQRFEEGYNLLGRRWKKISMHFVKTRNIVQVSCYGQKHVNRLSEINK